MRLPPPPEPQSVLETIASIVAAVIVTAATVGFLLVILELTR